MPPKPEKRIPAVFFKTTTGAQPVRKWLKDMDEADRKIIGTDIAVVEYGWPIGMPACRPITGRKGLWEVRSKLPGNRIARVLFCSHKSQMVLLHGFIKKTEQTPDRDLDLAEKRKKEFEQ